jgi:hypothetical protein
MKAIKRFVLVGLIGLMLIPLMTSIQAVKPTITTTYHVHQCYFDVIVDNATNVKGTPIFLRKAPWNDTFIIGLYTNIHVEGTARELNVWFPILGSFIQNPRYTICNDKITLDIKCIGRATYYLDTENNTFWLCGRAYGIALTVEN